MGTQRYIDMTFDLSYPSEHPKFLQRLGESTPTDIVVQVKNKGVNYTLAGVTLGFEMRNDNDKIMIDKDQSRFTIVSATQGIFSYRPPEQMQSFFGNSYLAYFTFESGGTRITTERFRFYNDEDVQLAIAPELQEHYVSVIDDLIESNEGAMAKAEEIKALIQNNQVVKKAGDTMTGDLSLNKASGNRYLAFTKGGTLQYYVGSQTQDKFHLRDQVNNTTVFEYDPVAKLFTMFSDTNLLKKTDYTAKDGRATLTLTSDATSPMSGNAPRALRRGNTVTLLGSIRRNASSTSNIMTTLPTDMRPIEDINLVVQATDGTAVQVFIGSNSGNITFSVADKHVLLCETYVVN